jgi:hypothetical protein
MCRRLSCPNPRPRSVPRWRDAETSSTFRKGHRPVPASTESLCPPATCRPKPHARQRRKRRPVPGQATQRRELAFGVAIVGFRFVGLIRRICLPRSALVSLHHGMHPEPSPTGALMIRVLDDVDYNPAPLTDAEFASALEYLVTSGSNSSQKGSGLGHRGRRLGPYSVRTLSAGHAGGQRLRGLRRCSARIGRSHALSRLWSSSIGLLAYRSTTRRAAGSYSSRTRGYAYARSVVTSTGRTPTVSARVRTLAGSGQVSAGGSDRASSRTWT